MVSAMNLQSRMLLMASLVTFSMFWSDALRAQNAAPLPDYVTAQFGNPPAIPECPLSEAVQSAVQVAFIDSMEKSIWGGDQTIALAEIADSKDPRLVWIISDMLRFSPSQRLNKTLTDAAFKLLEKESPNHNHWAS